LRKVSDLINLPVINLASGSQIAKVNDIVLNADDDVLQGFLCENKLLSLKNIKNLGKDAIMVEGDELNSLLESVKIPVNPPLFLPEYILATPIVTEQGECIGTVGDILIEENTGKIMGYEVSDGLLKDLVKGRSIITVPQIITYGEDAVVVREEQREMV